MGKSVLITCLTSNMTMLFLHFDTGRSIEFKNFKLRGCLHAESLSAPASPAPGLC